MVNNLEKLREIVEKHSDILADSQKLKSLLKDYFPADKRLRNLLIMAIDEGILDDIRGMDKVGKSQMHNYIKRIVDAYGVAPEVAQEAIFGWAEALEIESPIFFGGVNHAYPHKVKLGKNVIDYSDSSMDDFFPTGKTLRFSGIGAKVFPYVKLNGGNYVVIVTYEDDLRIAFYDGRGEYNAVASSSNSVYHPYGDIDFSEPGFLEVRPDEEKLPWVIEMIPMSGD